MGPSSAMSPSPASSSGHAYRKDTTLVKVHVRHHRPSSPPGTLPPRPPGRGGGFALAVAEALVVAVGEAGASSSHAVGALPQFRLGCGHRSCVASGGGADVGSGVDGNGGGSCV